MQAIKSMQACQPCPAKVPLSVYIILALILMASACYHAIVTHGTEAQEVADCVNKGGSIQQYESKDTRITICLISGNKPKGVFGILIEDLKTLENRTAYFFKNGREVKLCDVEYYVNNMGKLKVIFKK